ncbi:MAG: hypothetical protein IJH65_11160 [Methanobrevibacter sp.]|nr:hypothetical protein [Methanobrevibacter sp.]
MRKGSDLSKVRIIKKSEGSDFFSWHTPMTCIVYHTQNGIVSIIYGISTSTSFGRQRNHTPASPMQISDNCQRNLAAP